MKRNPNTDAQEAIKIIQNNTQNTYGHKDFKGYNPCYKFSNENISEYYPEKIKNALTVCGSGDQVLCAILNGAQKIDCFDSNPLTYYTMMLKIYLIKNLDYETFLDFYSLSNNTSSQKNIYNIIHIDNEVVRIFWDEVFKNTPDIENIFNKNDDKSESLFKGIPYLNKENFYKLKSIIDNCEINFITCDIFEIFKHFTQEYDFINFSNIFDYLSDISSTLKYAKLIIDAKTNHLTNNGTIIVNYSWNKMHTTETVELISGLLPNPQQKNIQSTIENDTNSILYHKK